MFKKSEQNKTNYMQELDQWLDDNVIDPLSAAFEQYSADAEAGLTQDEAAAKVTPVVEEVKQAIKQKVLDSFHNGKAVAAPTRRFPKERRR